MAIFFIFLFLSKMPASVSALFVRVFIRKSTIYTNSL